MIKKGFKSYFCVVALVISGYLPADPIEQVPLEFSFPPSISSDKFLKGFLISEGSSWSFGFYGAASSELIDLIVANHPKNLENTVVVLPSDIEVVSENSLVGGGKVFEVVEIRQDKLIQILSN